MDTAREIAMDIVALERARAESFQARAELFRGKLDRWKRKPDPEILEIADEISKLPPSMTWSEKAEEIAPHHRNFFVLEKGPLSAEDRNRVKLYLMQINRRYVLKLKPKKKVPRKS